MSDIRFNQWLHQSGTGGVTQLSSGHVGIGTTSPLIPVHSGNNAVLNVGVVTANNIYAGTLNGTLALSDISGITGSFTSNVSINGNLDIADKIRHIGDTNTALRFPAADTITAETGGSERVRINSDGIVIKNAGGGGGIAINALGTTSEYGLISANANRPNENDLILGLGASWNGDSVAQIDFRTGSDTTNKDNGKIIFYTQSNNSGGLEERLRITSGGLVGVNCTPVGMLEVQKNGVPAIIANYNNSKHLQMGSGGSGAGFHVTTGNFFTINQQPYADRGTDNNLTERFRISSEGYVTKPNHPSFIAGRTGGNQTFTVGTFPLNVARLNVGNHYNTSTYKFVAPVAGVYYFYGQVYYNNGTGTYRVGFRKTPNGGSAFMLNTAQLGVTGNDNQQNVSIIESLAVGDTVELYSDQNGSIQCYYNINAGNYGAHTYFMGYLIG